MGSIGRYMFRATMGAFLITLVSLTVVIWFTQAMRDFDLITSQRQTLLVFVGITGLIIPLLVMMIAPIALVMAAAHVLNKLSSDSEIIVMNAAGVSPWRLLRPFIAGAVVVSLLVAVIAAYVSPRSLRELRDWGAQVRADILTNIVQPGRFTTVGGNLTFHIADRRPNGLLVGIFVDDRRDPNEHATYLAEQGEIVKNDSGSFLVLDRRQHSAARSRPARSAHRDVRPLSLSICRNSPAARRTSSIPSARNTSGSCYGRGPTTRSMRRSRINTARNCMIGWRRRSIRWPSSSSPSPFSVRRRPRGKAARWRCWR